MTPSEIANHLDLRRVRQTEFATYGRIAAMYTTLELPWRGNAVDVSCIPPTIDAHGVRTHAPFTAERYLSPDHGYVVFRLIDVPGRGFIELHIGCLPRDSKGCILLGLDFGPVDYADGQPGASGDGITQSRAAFRAFMASHPEQRFTLDVYDVPAEGVADAR